MQRFPVLQNSISCCILVYICRQEAGKRKPEFIFYMLLEESNEDGKETGDQVLREKDEGPGCVWPIEEITKRWYDNHLQVLTCTLNNGWKQTGRSYS